MNLHYEVGKGLFEYVGLYQSSLGRQFAGLAHSIIEYTTLTQLVDAYFICLYIIFYVSLNELEIYYTLSYSIDIS